MTDRDNQLITLWEICAATLEILDDNFLQNSTSIFEGEVQVFYNQVQTTWIQIWKLVKEFYNESCEDNVNKN